MLEAAWIGACRVSFSPPPTSLRSGLVGSLGGDGECGRCTAETFDRCSLIFGVSGVVAVFQTYSFKTNRDSMAIADQSLDVIQAWGEAFLPRRVSRSCLCDWWGEL